MHYPLLYAVFIVVRNLQLHRLIDRLVKRARNDDPRFFHSAIAQPRPLILHFVVCIIHMHTPTLAALSASSRDDVRLEKHYRFVQKLQKSKKTTGKYEP